MAACCILVFKNVFSAVPTQLNQKWQFMLLVTPSSVDTVSHLGEIMNNFVDSSDG